MVIYAWLKKVYESFSFKLGKDAPVVDKLNYEELKQMIKDLETCQILEVI